MQAASYKVSRITGRLNYDSVPVAKIVDYPLEPRDYRPFAQCILCMSETSLHLRMWAFEVSPGPTSALHCVLYLFADKPDTGLKITVEHGVDHEVTVGCALVEGGGEQPVSLAVTTHPHNGEDLQGVYWGMSIDLPLAEIEKAVGPTLLEPGNSFPGNFFKTSAVPGFAHMGSYFPAQFPDYAFSRSSMQSFDLVNY